MITSSNNLTIGHIQIGSSSLIDFAFWILLQDGLHVHPFDKHSGGNQILQNQEFNAQLWHNWLKIILIHHDNRLFWHVPDINKAAAEKVKSFQELLEVNNQIHNVICNQEWQNEQQQYYLEQLTQQEQSYQEALTDYLGLDINLIKKSNPAQLWVANKTIQETLTRLWNEYQTLKYSNSFINEILQIPRFWEIELTQLTNKHREIYLVDYPYEVEIFVEPIFGIVSVPNVPVNQKELELRIMNVIQDS